MGLGIDEVGVVVLWFVLDIDLLVLVDVDGLIMLVDYFDLVVGCNVLMVLMLYVGEFVWLVGVLFGDDCVGVCC